MLVATEKVASFKDWLGFVTEQLFFTWMLWRFVGSDRGVRLLLGSVAAAMVVVGMIAVVERYRDVNLAATFILGMKDDGRTITATFRHRILFGYFMAMGFPIMLALVSLKHSKWGARAAWLGLLLSAAGSYLSISRGPWLGTGLGGMFLAGTGGRKVRRILLVLGVAAAAVMLTRPGVYGTLARLYEHSTTTDTQKGRSFQYRFELYHVAWQMLKTSPERTLFGFGGGSLETMDLSSEFQYGGNAGNLGYTSWDSEIAAMLMKFGIVGVAVAGLLYGSAGVRLLHAWRNSHGEDRLIVAGCTGTFAIYMFSMTNVAIFNPQLPFLAWLAVVMGLKVRSLSDRRSAVEDSHVEEVFSSNVSVAWHADPVLPESRPAKAAESMGVLPGY